MTVDTASDIRCISLLFLKRHPTLCKATIEPVPPSCMSLNVANGLQLEVIIGLIELPTTLVDITRRIDALVIPSPGPDYVLLDNGVMSRFGAVLDWKNQLLKFSCSTVTILAIHESTDTHSRLTPPTSSPAAVAAVHKDAEIHAVKLRDRFNVRAWYAAVVTAYTDENRLTILN